MACDWCIDNGNWWLCVYWSFYRCHPTVAQLEAEMVIVGGHYVIFFKVVLIPSYSTVFTSVRISNQETTTMAGKSYYRSKNEGRMVHFIPPNFTYESLTHQWRILGPQLWCWGHLKNWYLLGCTPYPNDNLQWSLVYNNNEKQITLAIIVISAGHASIRLVHNNKEKQTTSVAVDGSTGHGSILHIG